MTTLSSLALTQLLITRLCHDITGPVGAINNGIEVIAEDPSMREQAMELIASSALQAGARLQFYRYLFGLLKGEGVVNMDDRKAMVANFYHGSRIDVQWQQLPTSMTQAECQILCNLLLIAGGALMRGGVITVTVTSIKQSVNSIVLKSAGTQVRLDEELNDALLHHDQHTPTAKSVQAYYTALLVAEQSGQLDIKKTETECILHYTV